MGPKKEATEVDINAWLNFNAKIHNACLCMHYYIVKVTGATTSANANLAAMSGHAHLAEPGCLCTKQALIACASKLSWSLGYRNDQLPSHTKWCGHPKSHLDHC